MYKRIPKIGVLALMLEDYLPLFDGIQEAQTAYVREILASLEGTADYVFPHVAMNREQIETLVKQYNADGLDGIVIFLLTYSQGMYLVHAMQDNHLPLALALVQPEQTVRKDFIEWDYTVNQGIHGSQDNANCLMRANLPCAYFVGDRTAPAFKTFMENFAAAAHAVCAMRTMKIGVIGKLPGMGDVFTDDMAIFRKLGPELQYDSIGTIQHYCAEISGEAVAAQVAFDDQIYDVDPAMPRSVHEEAARMYLGLRTYLEQHGLSGYTLHYGECGEDGRFSQLPLLAASNLLADGYGYAAEGDSTAAILVAAMHTLCGCANFTEMYMMDFVRRAILFCHQGEGNWKTCRAGQKPFLKDRILSEGGLSNPPTPIFTPEPGRACVLSLTHVSADRFRLLCVPGEILDESGLLNVDMPYMFFRPDSGVENCITGWLESGGTHHEAVVYGDMAERVQLFCKLMDIEYKKL